MVLLWAWLCQICVRFYSPMSYLLELPNDRLALKVRLR
jgi:hypothetical protein